MKHVLSLAFAVACFVVHSATAQTDSLKIENSQDEPILEETKVDTDSLILISIQGLEEMFEHLVPRYRLYETSNMWTFLKLDTQTGQIWQVQFSTNGPEYRYEVVLNEVDLSFGIDNQPGRFELHKTQNIYNFLLIDQVRGRVWQIQWGKPKDRQMIRIS